ncbi:type II toxin-antitoxin system RelE/ParE family toxin [Anabaena sp. UHCC 0253]|uniref:type II toxin-antitoxin system RelE/ParE family toxin n=1 Tax=Anabaena sp. UHCC 0253 TaxID=2590019 RepID=UPI0014480C93|nr:type II toxin-antitoxin system RelE/ParE family toxin [Anabaena sp. UHCC 0253]
MYKLKNSLALKPTPQALAKVTDSTFQTANSIATESTFQTADSITFLETRIPKYMTYEVEYTDEFEQWYVKLDEAEQDSIDVMIELLEERGTNLRFPRTSDVKGSRHGNIRELRVQHQGKPYRILYAFDPRRVAILLLGGNKTGNDRWYEENVPKADKLYDELLKELNDEGLI